MFTGIIQHIGAVRQSEQTSVGRRLFIDLGPLADGLRVGDSVAVNGVCLTAERITNTVSGFDVMAETLDRTNLGQLRTGSAVNLERALRLGDRLDGHMVQGHVDGLARLERVDASGGQCVMCFACSSGLSDEMVPKGSLAIDGVSLTLVGVNPGSFSVSLIPTTLEKTNLGKLRRGEQVNIETDILGKYVRRAIGADKEVGLTMEKLRTLGLA